MSLLERFQSGSKFDSNGQFTIDESKARQKMARFQLSSPTEFLMLTIQAAVASNCHSVQVTQEGPLLRLVASGADLDPEAVREHENFLFESDKDALPYHLLGVAANAVEPQCIKPPLVAMLDGELHFEVDFKQPLNGWEEAILERLAYLPCALTLNALSYEARALPEGSLLDLNHGDVSSIRLIRYGVQVHHENSKRPINFDAAAIADDLSLDASFSQVVKNKAYQELLKRLDAKANLALAEFVRAYTGEGVNTRLLDQLKKKHPNPAGEALENCRLFPLADRAGMLSLQEIRDIISSQGQVLVAKRRYNLQMDSPVVLIESSSIQQILTQIFNARSLQDAEGKLETQMMIAARRKSWENSPRPVELPAWDYLCQGMAEGRTWKAAIGFLVDSKTPSRADILFQGHLLCSESLSNLPPGAIAVIDVLEGAVEPSWLGLEKKRNQQVLKEVTAEMTSLWRAQTEFDIETLSAETVGYLLGELQSSRPSSASKNTPLFPRLDGQPPDSFTKLSQLAQVRMGKPFTPSEMSDKLLGTDPIYAHGQQRFLSLRARLGAKVVDLTPLQTRLETLQEEWNKPRRPKFTQQLFISKSQFSLNRNQGEVGLVKQGAGGLSLQLLYRGALIEELTISATRKLASKALVEATDLTLLGDFSGFVKNSAYSDLLAAVVAQARSLERQEIFGSSLTADLRLALLSDYSYNREEIATLHLFPNTTHDKYATLNALAAEFKLHGSLLHGKMRAELPGRHVIPSDNKTARTQLEAFIPGLKWSDAQTAFDQLRRVAQFQELRVESKIALKEKFPLRLEFAEGRGEIGIRSQSTARKGSLHAYVEGRLVCVKSDMLPPDFEAALEHPDLVLSSNYNDVVISENVHQLLRQSCDTLMLRVAQSSGDLRLRAWHYFASLTPSEEAKQAFIKQLKVPILDGTLRPIEELVTLKIQGYVRPEFRPELPVRGAALRLSDTEARLLHPFLGKRLSQIENFLVSEATRRVALETLPKALPQGTFGQTYQEAKLQATLGICINAPLVGLDAAGGPVGVLRSLELPVAGFVSPTKRGKEKDDSRPEAVLEREQQIQLEEWAESLCLEWVKKLDGRVGSKDDRALAIILLKVNQRHLSSSKSGIGSELASLLWDMPLFSRADHTLVSGAALAATLAETGEPLLQVSSSFRAPEAALVLSPDGQEYALLSTILGKAALSTYEAPPLLQLDEIARNTKLLITWGLAPVRAGLKAVSRASDYITELGQRITQADKGSGSQEPVQPQRDPQEILLVRLREDVRSLLGRRHFQESDQLFQNLDFGKWPLGPPIYRPRKARHFRLNLLNSNVRWLLTSEGTQAEHRTVRMLLLIHWVGLVNVASEQLADNHEEEFLDHLVERMAQTFSINENPTTTAEVEISEKPKKLKKTLRNRGSRAPEGLFPSLKTPPEAP